MIAPGNQKEPDPLSDRTDFPGWSRRLAAIWVAVVLAMTVLPAAWEEQPFGLTKVIGPQGELNCLRDFTSHLRFGRLFWTGALHTDEVTSVYTPAAHARLLDNVPPPVAGALPFAYSPTFLWLLAPFTLLPDRASYILWTALSLAALTSVVCRRNDLLLTGCLFFFGPVAHSSLFQGQTAVFSVAAIWWLQRVSASSSRRWMSALILWALSAKPPLAITAGAALLLTGRSLEVCSSLCLVLVTTALLHPWLGPTWIGDYVHMLQNYNIEQAAPLFAWSLYPSYMSNLRAVLFFSQLGDALAAQISSFCWILSLLVIAGVSRGRRSSPAEVWSMLILALLLFSPHLNITEELHLFLVAVAAPQLAALLSGVVVFWLNLPLYLGPDWAWPWAAFAGKSLLLASIIARGPWSQPRLSTGRSDLPG